MENVFWWIIFIIGNLARTTPIGKCINILLQHFVDLYEDLPCWICFEFAQVQVEMKVVVINKFGNWSFYVVDLQRTATKCIKVYDTRADPLFCSSSLLFGEVPRARDRFRRVLCSFCQWLEFTCHETLGVEEFKDAIETLFFFPTGSGPSKQRELDGLGG